MPEPHTTDHINWDLIQALAVKPHKHLHIVENAQYGVMADGRFDNAQNGVGEVMQEARTVQHLCDLAGIPEGTGYDAHIDARVFQMLAELGGLRERLGRIAGWHARESAGSGMVGDFCTECGTRFPCATRRMAEGVHEDAEVGCDA